MCDRGHFSIRPSVPQCLWATTDHRVCIGCGMEGEQRTWVVGTSQRACVSHASYTHADTLFLQVVQEQQATAEEKGFLAAYWDRLAQASACSIMVDAVQS